VAQNDVQSATALPVAPVDDRRRRMRAYSLAMSLRMVCLILVFVVPGWWKAVFGIGAVVLPYVAVVLANAGSTIATIAVRPGAPKQLAIEQQRPPE
jgi:type IV secretory pathway TrbD component